MAQYQQQENAYKDPKSKTVDIVTAAESVISDKRPFYQALNRYLYNDSFSPLDAEITRIRAELINNRDNAALLTAAKRVLRFALDNNPQTPNVFSVAASRVSGAARRATAPIANTVGTLTSTATTAVQTAQSAVNTAQSAAATLQQLGALPQTLSQTGQNIADGMRILGYGALAVAVAWLVASATGGNVNEG